MMTTIVTVQKPYLGLWLYTSEPHLSLLYDLNLADYVMNIMRDVIWNTRSLNLFALPIINQMI